MEIHEQKKELDAKYYYIWKIWQWIKVGSCRKIANINVILINNYAPKCNNIACASTCPLNSTDFSSGSTVVKAKNALGEGSLHLESIDPI